MTERDPAATDATYALIQEISRGLQFGQHSSTKVTDADVRRVSRNLIASSFQIEQASIDGERIDGSEGAASAVARAWESIAHLTAPPSIFALTNAAFAYELAGYQANAFSIAKNLQKTVAAAPPVLHLALMFLHRDFRSLTAISKTWASDPKSIPGEFDDRYRLVTVLFAQAMLRVARAFLAGDLEELSRAKDELLLADKGSTYYGLFEESALCRSLTAVLPTMRDRSTWIQLSKFFDRDPRWKRYAKLLARGIHGGTGSGRRAIVELWPSQIVAIESGVVEQLTPTVVSMPTSSGKTRIAELLIIECLTREQHARCVYLAPFRSLATEVTASLTPILSDLGFHVGSFVESSVDTNTLEQTRIRKTSVLVVTPEKLDLLVRANPEFAKRIRLVIVDEGHVLGEGERGLKFEVSLARLKSRFSLAKVAFLSAVVSEETLGDLARWVGANDASILRTGWRPTVQHLARLDFSEGAGTLSYDERTAEIDPTPLFASVDYTIKGKTGNDLPRQFPEPGKRADVAAAAAFALAESGSVMIYATQTNNAEVIAASLAKRIRIEREVRDTVPSYFVERPGLKSAIVARELYPTAEQWLRLGIAVHHGKVPEPLRQAIEDDFRAGHLRVLIATGTLAQGVNMPVRSVIFHSWNRYDKGIEKIVTISVREFWNVAGRAGRAGIETQALIAFVALTEQDRYAFLHYKNMQNLEPVESVFLQRLLDLAGNRISPGADLDSQILAMLAEEGGMQLPEGVSLADYVFDSSLASVQATRKQISIPRLKATFAEATDGVRNAMNEIPELQAFAQTGFCVASCIAIRVFVLSYADRVQNALVGDDPADLTWLASKLVSLDIVELAHEDTMYSARDVVEMWLDGAEVAAISKRLQCTEAEASALAKYIEDVVTGQLSWVANAFLCIACAVFELDPRGLSNHMQYFTAMIRFGLPNVYACWAMRSGVPLRSVASNIGNAFVSVISDGHRRTEAEFELWYAQLSPGDFVDEFDLPIEFLDNIERGRSEMYPAFVTRDNAEIDKALPIAVSVDYFSDRVSVAIDDILDVERDYENKLDRNAVVLNVKGRRVASLPYREASLLAPEIETGADLQAHVVDRSARRLQLSIVRNPAANVV